LWVLSGFSFLSAKGRFFDVNEYGAKGDGVTDDAPAIKAAVDAACDAGAGTVYFPPGKYLVNSATVGGYDNDCLGRIDSNNITIMGAAGARIIVSGTTPISLFFARNVSNIRIEGIQAVGNSQGERSNIRGTFFWYDNSGGTKDINGVSVERCTLENFKATEWIYILAFGDHNIRNVKIKDCRFTSRSGNLMGEGASGENAGCIRVGGAGTGTGDVEDVEICGCWAECTYIKEFLEFRGSGGNEVIRARVYSNEVWNPGANLKRNNAGSYAFNYYAAAHHISSWSNRIYNPWSCGFYTVSGTYLDFTDNYITGQVDTTDGTLCKGAYAIPAGNHVTIKGGTVEHCAIGIQVQGTNMYSNVDISGVQITDCGLGIDIRETGGKPDYWNTGGFTVRGCHLVNSSIRMRRSSTAGVVGDIILAQNILENSYIRASGKVNGLTITGNMITSRAGTFLRAIELNTGRWTITDNVISGPGSGVADSYGLYLYSMTNPSVVANNTIQGFYYGLYGNYGACAFHDNVFHEVTDIVANAVAGDLGRDDPATFPNTVATYWRKGQFVQNMYPSTTGNNQGWLCVGPTHGDGCTYSAAAFTGGMNEKEYVIRNVNDMSKLLPGTAITLANAAAGPATLSTVVQSWQVDYGSGSRSFEAGEYVEDNAAKGLAILSTDNGSNQMQIVSVSGTFTIGSTIKGHHSGATAKIVDLGLKCADACGHTVKDAALSPVTPRFVVVPPTTRDSP